MVEVLVVKLFFLQTWYHSLIDEPDVAAEYCGYKGNKITSSGLKFLKLIGIDYLKNKDDYEINLIFDNNAHISLKSETIEVRLEDQSEIK